MNENMKFPILVLVLMGIKIIIEPSETYESASWVVWISLGVAIIYFLGTMKSNLSDRILKRIRQAYVININMVIATVFIIFSCLVVFKIPLPCSKAGDIFSILALIITLATNKVAIDITNLLLKRYEID